MRLRGCPERGRMLVQHPLQRIPRILQEMPAIGDLACLRRALGRPFSIGSGPITTRLCLTMS